MRNRPLFFWIRSLGFLILQGKLPLNAVWLLYGIFGRVGRLRS